MSKVKLGPGTWVYPMPTLLIGANVDDKPNFMTAAWCGVANGDPPMISIAIRPQRYTHKGIMQNQAFSVNVPSADLIRETDYCGIVSGAKADKVKMCKFTVFYGKLGNAPLIEQCPINLECKAVHILGLGSHSLIVGRVEETHVSDACLTEGKLDVNKIKPIIFTVESRHYYSFGEVIGKAFHIGLELEGKKRC